MPIAEIRKNLLRVLSMSASMLGFFVAGIGLLNANPKAQGYVGLGDDVLGFRAILFLACTYLAFWALRTTKKSRISGITRVADVLFIVGLTLVVVSGVGIVYAIF